VQIATDQWTFFGEQEFDADGHVRHVGHNEGEDPWFKRVGWKERIRTAWTVRITARHGQPPSSLGL
jgi:hypothetical protein